MLSNKLRPEQKVRKTLKKLKFNMKKPESEPYPPGISLILILIASGVAWLVAIEIFKIALELGSSAVGALMGK